MARKKTKKRLKLGLAPGTPIFTGTRKMDDVDISVLRYNETLFDESTAKHISQIFPLHTKQNETIWLNINGLHEERIIEEICINLDLHKLSVEDILSIGQRPKIEEYETYLHAVIKTLDFNDTNKTLEYEQISFILKENLLITFQEKPSQVFNGVYDRLSKAKGLIRKKGADYLLYALLDSVIDKYFMELEEFGEKLEDMETELLQNPNKKSLNKLHLQRRETLELRRSLYPLREMINDLSKLENPLFSKNIKIYIRDLHDHTHQVLETIEIFRDTTSSLLDLYINSTSNKMNEIMKVLTIMTSIFIPLSFIASVYGMNFIYMPELNYKYGYFIVLGIMLVVLIGLLVFLKRKKWL